MAWSEAQPARICGQGGEPKKKKKKCRGDVQAVGLGEGQRVPVCIRAVHGELAIVLGNVSSCAILGGLRCRPAGEKKEEKEKKKEKKKMN